MKPFLPTQYNQKIFFDLLIASSGAIVIIYLSSNIGYINRGIWLSLILFFLIIRDFRRYIIENNTSGIIFGIISVIISIYFSSINEIIIFISSCLIVYLLNYIISKLFSDFRENDSVSSAIILLIPIIFLLTLNLNMNFFEVTKYVGMILVLIASCFVIVISTFLVKKFISFNFIKHFYLPLITFLLFLITNYISNNNRDLQEVLKPSMLFLMWISFVTFFSRLLSIMISSKQTNSIKNYFKFFFGKKTGDIIFKILFGNYYRGINFLQLTILMFIILLIIFLNYYLTGEVNISCLNINFFNNYRFAIILALPFWAMRIFTEVIELFSLKYMKGLKGKEAREKSITLGVRYLWLIIGLLIIKLNISLIKKINIIYVIVFIIWITLVFYSISKSLFIDFKTEKFNKFKITRNAIAVFLYGVNFFSFILFLFNNKFILFVIIIPFLCILISKLVGYDTEISSLKLKNKSKDSLRKFALVILLIICINGLNIFLLPNTNNLYISLIRICFLLSKWILILVIYEVVRLLPIIILPFTNNIDGDIKDFLTFKRLRFLSETKI